MATRLRSIQVLRGVAATSVVIGHAGHFAIGSIGVDLFFVISGFVIANAIVGRTPSDFLLDRVVRIFPIYYVHLAPWLLVASISHQMTLERTMASLTLWPVYSEIVSTYIIVAWTLSFELLFYTTAAACLILRRPFLLFVAYIAATVVAYATGWPIFVFIGNPIIIEFIFGLCIARLPLKSNLAPLAIAAGILLLFASDPDVLKDPTSVFDLSLAPLRVIAWGVPSALVVYGLLGCEERLGHRLWKLPAYVGDASYSIYLSHLAVLLFFPSLWPTGAAVSLGVGVLWYEFTERPLLKWYRMKRGYVLARPAHV